MLVILRCEDMRKVYMMAIELEIIFRKERFSPKSKLVNFSRVASWGSGLSPSSMQWTATGEALPKGQSIFSWRRAASSSNFKMEVFF